MNDTSFGDRRLPHSFWNRVLVDPASECWSWTGRVNASGYGTYGRGLAHRVLFERLIGCIAPRNQLDHTCHDARTCREGDRCVHRRCVNPAHLDSVAPRINVARSGGPAAKNTAKTHCPQGHPYDAQNTRPVVAEGRRRCRICRAEQFRRAHARRRDRLAAA